MPTSTYLPLFNPGKPPAKALDISRPVLLADVIQYAQAADPDGRTAAVRIPDRQWVCWNGRYFRGAETDQPIESKPGAVIAPDNWWVGEIAPYSKIAARKAHFDRFLESLDQESVDLIDWMMAQVCDGTDAGETNPFHSPAVWLQIAELACSYWNGGPTPCPRFLQSCDFLEERLLALWGSSLNLYDEKAIIRQAIIARKALAPVLAI